MNPKGRVAALATGGLLSTLSPFASATVFIGLQQGAGPIVTVASNASGFATFAGAFGEIETVAVSAFGQPSTVLPLLLQTTGNVQNSAGAANAGTFSIYLTSTNNTAPLDPVQFGSGFAGVSLAGWTLSFSNYLDPANGVYALTHLLGSATFTGVNSATDIAIQDPGTGPYSVTTVYSISVSSLGGATASAALSVSPVPEPSTALLMVVGLGLAGWAARRRS